MHRKHALIAASAAGALGLFTVAARADISLFTTAADWGGAAGYAGASGETGWNGWGSGASYPNPANPPQTSNGLPLTFTTSLDSSAVNGIGNYDNTSNTTGTPGDDNYADTNWGGQTTSSGGLTMAGYTGAYVTVVSGEFGGNTPLINALVANSGGNLAIDFTLPGGATSLSSIGATYMSMGITSYSNGYDFSPAVGTTAANGTGQADFGTTQSSPGSTTSDQYVDNGSYIIDDGNGVFTAVLPYKFSTTGGSYGQMVIYYNSNSTVPGNVTLDNLRILTPAVPEPATLGLTVAGIGALAARRRPRRKA